jgi:hypothetical protein
MRAANLDWELSPKTKKFTITNRLPLYRNNNQSVSYHKTGLNFNSLVTRFYIDRLKNHMHKK